MWRVTTVPALLPSYLLGIFHSPFGQALTRSRATVATVATVASEATEVNIHGK
jgi:hypothetical protein